MAQSAEDQARYLQDALAIARGTQSGTTTAETLRIRALAALTAQLLDALIWLEDTVCSMPTLQYDSSGVHHAIMNAREAIHAADGLTRTDEEQINLTRDAEAIAREFADEDQP